MSARDLLASSKTSSGTCPAEGASPGGGLGLGSQVKAHNERRFSVKFESPGPKMAEAVRAIRAIWDCWQNGTKLNFKGQFYTFDVMTPFFNPGPIEHPRVPIMIAAVNAYMCGGVGEFCEIDGLTRFQC